MNENNNCIISDGITQRITEVAGDNPAEFARKAGIKDQSFRRYLNGSMPTAPVIIKIADTSNVSVEWLLTGKKQQVSKDPLLDEALKKYKYLAEIKRRVELALEKGLSEEVLYENIKSEMDTALRELRDLKKETGCTPQGYSVG